MTVNIAWRDAMTEVGWSTTNEEHDSGWVESMRAELLALLQRPYRPNSEDIHERGIRPAGALFVELVNACEHGAIPHQAEVDDCFNGPRKVRRKLLWSALLRPKEEQERTVYRLTRPAFAVWLAAQGEEPSKHIAAWFKSQEVKNGPLVQQPGPVMAEHETMLYSDLVKYRQTKPGAPWTDDMRALLANEEASRKKRPGATGIRKSLGADMGCSDKRIGELIREHETAQRNSRLA